jgi:DNA-binding MarR family transcriptional regulator
LIRRSVDPGDARRILLRLTVKGAARLRSLSVAHREELRVKGPELLGALRAILSKRGDSRSR